MVLRVPRIEGTKKPKVIGRQPSLRFFHVINEISMNHFWILIKIQADSLRVAGDHEIK